MTLTRFVVVASHPIQYYAPFYRALAASSTLHVYAIFCSRIGLTAMLDHEMGVEMSWKTDLLAGYENEFLPEAASIRKTTFLGVDNPSVSSVLERVAPEIVLLHGYSWMTMLRALAWCRRQRIPALMISDSSLHSGTPATARLAKRLVLPWILRQFSGFLSIGDTNEKYLESYGVQREKIFRVPNMVDEGFWAHRRRREEEREKRRAALNLAESDLVVLFVGKLIPRKRPADLLAALVLLSRMQPSRRRVRVVFAGDGELRGELEATARKKSLPVDFLGFVNIDELPAIYCAADVLAHPAEIETFGVVVLEAAILGLPLVLSDRVGAIGPTSIARPGENTLVYPCCDVDALAAALFRLADQPLTLEHLSARSLAIADELDGRMSVSGTVAAVNYCLGREAAMLLPIEDSR